MKKISTKERILDEALNLFSERGYEGVSVDDIASAVGIKAPSLYKHYAGKEDIFNSLLDRIEEKDAVGFSSESNALPDTLKQFREYIMVRTNMVLTDPVRKKIRKLLTLEQYRNERASKLASCYMISKPLDELAKLFSKLIQSGLFKKDDEKELSCELLYPVILMVSMIDREPDREFEIIKDIKKHVKRFTKAHGVKKDKTL